jgi:hypothetical protein
MPGYPGVGKYEQLRMIALGLVGITARHLKKSDN